MKVYICFTGHEEGAHIHHTYRHSKDAEVWKKTIDKRLQRLKTLRNNALRSSDDVSHKVLDRFCKKYNLNSIDKQSWIEDVVLE